MDMNKIGSFIKNKRKELNMTQQELAEKLMVSDRTVSKWERGINFPDVSMYDSLCKELNITLVELLSGEEVEEKKKKEELERHLKNSINENKKMNKISEFANLFLIGIGIVYFFINIFIMGESLIDFPNMLGYVCVFIGLISFLFKSNMSSLKKWGICILGCIITWVITVIFGLLFLRFNFYNNFDTDPIYDVMKFDDSEIEKITSEMILDGKDLTNYYNQVGFVIYYPILNCLSDVKTVKAYYKYVDGKAKLIKIYFFEDDEDVLEKYYDIKLEGDFLLKIRDSYNAKYLYSINNEISVFKDGENYIFRKDTNAIIKNENEVNEDKLIEYALDLFKENNKITVYDNQNDKIYEIKNEGN